MNEAPEGFQDDLALFSIPPVETGVIGDYYRDFSPVGVLSASSVIEFNVPNTSPDYIRLNKTRLTLKLRILDDKGLPISAVDSVGLINLPSSTIFREMDLALQQTVVTTSVNSNYPYKVLLDTLLDYGVNDQLGWLSIAGFEKDTCNMMDDLTGANEGLDRRREKTAEGKEMLVRTALFMDIANQNRLIPSRVALNIKFIPQTDKFRLMYKTFSAAFEDSSDTPTPTPPAPKRTSKFYSLQITSAVLSVCFVRIHPGLLIANEKMFESRPAVIPYTRSDIKAFTIAQNNYIWREDNIFQDSIPKRVVIGLVSAESYSGHNEKNPFFFKNYDVESVIFEVNGLSATGLSISLNFSKQHIAQGYSTLFECNPPWQKEAPAITSDDYMYGYALYVVDLCSSKGQDFTTLSKKGTTSLSIRFNKPTPEGITAIVYGSFEAFINIDAPRNVVLHL